MTEGAALPAGEAARGERAPLVTVITPTYNRADYLPATIESILGQNYPHLEYLVIDDGSTDDTAAVVRRYVEAHPGKVRYFHHANCGEAASVNRGWRIATGDYVAIVSSDDPQLPGWLETCVSWMERHPQIIVGYPDWMLLDEDGRPLEEQRVPEYDYRLMLVHTNCLPGPGALIRRAAVRVENLRNPRFRYASDFETWLRLGLEGEFMRIPAAVGAWRKHPGSLTLQSDVRRVEEYCRAVDTLFAQRNLPAPLLLWRRRARANSAMLAARLVSGWNGERPATWITVRFLLRAFLNNPRGVSKREALRILRWSPANLLRALLADLGISGLRARLSSHRR